jgi:hypothetical protein
MRKIILSILVFATFLYYGSCRKENICACGVENPEDNLIWLKNRLEYYICEDIYQYIFEMKEYIIIETCPLASDPMKEVFDCVGNIVCTRGGFASGYCPLPLIFWENYESKKVLLFKHRSSPI